MRSVRSMLISALMVSAPLWLAGAAPAQQTERQAATPKMKYDFAPVRIPPAAAEKALKTFAALLNKDNFRSLGFRELGEGQRATLGTPVEEFMIRLDELAKYTAGQEPSQLLHRTERVTVPVLAGQQPQSSLTMTRKGGDWEASGFGASNYSRLLSETRERLAKQEGRSGAEYFEVRVPALNVSFLGAVSGGRLVFTPLLKDARFGFEAGKPLAADQALLKLVPAAKEHNRQPT